MRPRPALPILFLLAALAALPFAGTRAWSEEPSLPVESGLQEELVFVNTELSNVIEVFSRLGGMNLFLAQDLESRKITFFAKDLSLRQALDNMLATSGLKMRQTAPKTFVIYPAKQEDEFEGKQESHVFLFKNRDPKNMINVLKGIGKRTRVFMNESIDAVVMMDTAENIETAKRLVRQMDYALEQVLVDVKLVEVQSGAIRDLGPQLGSTALTFGEFKALPTARTNVILQSLIDRNRATILAAPRVRVLDKEKAEINVGDKIPIEITTSSRSAAGDNIQLNKTVQWENVGIKLRLEVVKIHPNGDITLKLYNEVSSVVRYTQAGYPEIRTRNADTILTLRDGVTVVFGGLMNTNDKKNVKEIPLLARLPGIGRLFKEINNETVHSEIVMFVTPMLGRGDDERIPCPPPSDAIRGIADAGMIRIASEPVPGIVKPVSTPSPSKLAPAPLPVPVATLPARDPGPVMRMGELMRQLKRNGN